MVFSENSPGLQQFDMTAGRTGRAKYQLCGGATLFLGHIFVILMLLEMIRCYFVALGNDKMLLCYSWKG